LHTTPLANRQHGGQVGNGKLAVTVQQQHPVIPGGGDGGFEGRGGALVAGEMHRAQLRERQGQAVQYVAGAIPAAVIADHDLEFRHIFLGGEETVPLRHHRFDALRLIIGGCRHREADREGQIAHAASSMAI
jgi:hypothetical protein